MAIAKSKLAAQLRTDTGKGVARQTRRDGRVPAVLYGKGTDPIPLTVEARETQRLISHVGSHAIIEIEISDAKEKNHMVLIKDVQRDAQKGFLRHLDFHKISMDAQIERVVPIQMVGESPATKLGGVLQHGAYEITIRGIAKEIPEVIKVDISELELGQNIRISELVLPAGIDLSPSANPDEVVASMLAPRGKAAPGEEVEEGAAEGEAGGEAQEPELIGRKEAEE